MIEYVLEDNILTKKDPNDRYARVVNVRSFSEEEIAEEIADSNVGISKAEALAMAETRARIILKRIAHGESANLRLLNVHFGIPGVFKEGEYPSEVTVRITPSKELAAAAGKNSLKRVEPTVTLKVDYVEDVVSGTTNEFITNGGNVKIFGHNLKIVEKTLTPQPPEGGQLPEGKLSEPVCRVEFISLEDPGASYIVPPVNLVINNPSELLIVAPRMMPDEPVQLKITTQYSGHSKSFLKAPRSVIFEKTFTVKE
ncbi:MAG: DUF4469 domain-containing protein [Dysgonamonadaceae bacterium]|jgi:hypothetical protein|nr:DUF4469 domain-containing protein [Dysgonamonadaceae bacterium]